MLKSSGSVIKDPDVAALFSSDDPEKLFPELNEIGHGSFGAVYSARNITDKEVVAIKKMSYQGRQSSDKWQEIVKEVKFQQSVKHKNCVGFKGFYLKDQTAWLVMEYCIGSASNLIEVHKRALEEVEIAAICYEALHGLEYLHSRQCIHRDIKAGNILLTEDGAVKLADFGSASTASPANTFVGTPYWMAPEVILAMENGQYNERVDIWSLGITCVELAEQRPPLFNMNAMSALYHIAQNDPPSLTTPGDWSNDFVNFVNTCLTKDPSCRPSASECLKLSFVTNDRRTDILHELICRTINAVKELDSLQAERFQRKIKFALQEANGDVGDGATASVAAEDISTGDESTEESHSSKSGSIASQQSQASEFSISSVHRVGGGVDSGHVTPSQPSESSDSLPSIASRHLMVPDQKTMPASAAACSNVATIRTTSIVSQQQRQRLAQNFMREQMNNYKQMRRQHFRQLQQLEHRQKEELNELQLRLDKETQARLASSARELEVDLQKQAKELERSQKSAVTLEAKRRKQIQQQHEQELKQLHQQQKKEYQKNKDELRKSLELANKRDSLQLQKDSLKQQHQQTEQQLLQQHHAFLDLELRRLRRCKLLQYHLLEQNLLHEHLDHRQMQLDIAHETDLRNDEMIRDTEYKQLAARHQLRDDLLRRQHEVELTNQREYMQRAEIEQKQRHLMETRQQPRNLKAKEQEIRRQFRAAVNIQQKQYKLLKEQLLIRTSKAEQKAMLAKLKDEQTRRLAMLSEQYEQSITEVMQHQCVRLDTTQIAEASGLRHRLQDEMDLLVMYQSKICSQTDALRQRERKELDERVSQRRAELLQKIEVEAKEFMQVREQKTKDLELRQQHDLREFDQESASLGLSAATDVSSASTTMLRDIDELSDTVRSSSLNIAITASPKQPENNTSVR